jgi:hypothetical protein
MMKAKAILAEIYGEAAVLAVAEGEPFVETDVDGYTMYKRPCGGCVNHALIKAAKPDAEILGHFPSWPTTDRLLFDSKMSQSQVDAVTELVDLNDKGKLATREDLRAALLDEE